MALQRCAQPSLPLAVLLALPLSADPLESQRTAATGFWAHRGARERFGERPLETLCSLVENLVQPGDQFLDLKADMSNWLRPVGRGAHRSLAGAKAILGGPAIWLDWDVPTAAIPSIALAATIPTPTPWVVKTTLGTVVVGGCDAVWRASFMRDKLSTQAVVTGLRDDGCTTVHAFTTAPGAVTVTARLPDTSFVVTVNVSEPAPSAPSGFTSRTVDGFTLPWGFTAHTGADGQRLVCTPSGVQGVVHISK